MTTQSHEISQAHGQLTAFFLQSFSWGDSLSDGTSIGVCTSADTPSSCAAKLPFPTAADMITMRNTAIESGAPDLLIWYRWCAVAGTAGGNDPVLARIGPAGMAARLAALTEAINAPYPNPPVATTDPPGATAPAGPGRDPADRDGHHRHDKPARHRDRHRHRHRPPRRRSRSSRRRPRRSRLG